MSKYQLESGYGVLSLNGIAEMGRGIQALPGLTGMGIPPLQTQWSEGAGNGATYRGTRVRPRDLDFPLHLLGSNREHLKSLISEFAKVVTGGCRLRWIEQTGEEWWCDVRLVGGGSFIYGVDTIGSRELNTVVTFRAGDPFWTSSESQSLVITSSAGGVNPFVSKFMQLPLAPSQTLGSLTMNNSGDAPAYPVWQVRGPGTFKATSPTGQVIELAVALTSTQTLVIDTKNATATIYTDGNPVGANGYGNLASAPKFWILPPGQTSASVVMTGTNSNSKVTVTWNPRRWVVI